jgi:MerR family transcriptional regulator, light-induced transcriptional regulator
MEPMNGIYSIQQVADITGLSKQLIRKWEERYDIVHPRRLDNGYRTYTEKDINKLLTVKTLSNQGHSIKHAALILKEQNLDEEIFKTSDFTSNSPHEGWNDYVLELLQYGANCQEQGLNLSLQQAYHQLGLEECIKNVIIPFLKEVGNRWEKGEWSEFQETLSSHAVRDFLVQVRRNFPIRDTAPFIIGACLPHERHEVPLHILLLQVMLKGYKTLMIGASPAPGTIESLVTKLRPKMVLLSATTTIPFKEDPNILERLDQFAECNSDIDFYLGGAGSIEYATGKNLKAIHITNSMENLFLKDRL